MGHRCTPGPRCAPRPGSQLRQAWTAVQSSTAGLVPRAGLTLQVAHVSPHPLLLLLVPHLGVEPLFQASQGPFCLPQTPLQVHADLHLSLRAEARRGKWVLGGGPGCSCQPLAPGKPSLISPGSSGLSCLRTWMEVTAFCLVSYALHPMARTRPLHWAGVYNDATHYAAGFASGWLHCPRLAGRLAGVIQEVAC